MQIDTSLKSVNFSSRNQGHVEMLVFHSTAGTRRSDIPILLGQTSRRVSSHYYITKEGHVYQFVPDQYAAWHAGVSGWKGHGSGWIQDSSIGIELENLNNGRDPYPAVQIAAAEDLAQSLIAKYHIQPDMVVRHLDIALPIGRKSDPAGFPWVEFRELLFAGGSKPVSRETPQGDPRSGGVERTIQKEAPAEPLYERTTSAYTLDWWSMIAGAINRFLDGLRG